MRTRISSIAGQIAAILGLSIFGLSALGDAPPSQADETNSFEARLVAAAHERTRHVVTYDGRYRSIAYPGGDVPADTGVCTDVIIRSYRALGIDLQKAVHEDMRADFEAYPTNWGLLRPDPNIDHRRVPNLQTFFKRKGQSLSVTQNPGDYQPGDLVTWRVSRSLPHIGIIVDTRSKDGKRPLVVHNIGRGPQIEDMLFDYPITGHFRYAPEATTPRPHAPPADSRPSHTGPPSP